MAYSGAYVEEQRVLHLTWERCAACGSGQGRGSTRAGVSVWRRGCQGPKGTRVGTLVGLEVFFGSALVVGGGGGGIECINQMHQCGIDEWCVGSGGPPAGLMWSRVRGATGGREPPSPSAAKRPNTCLSRAPARPVISTPAHQRPRATGTRGTPGTGQRARAPLALRETTKLTCPALGD